MDDSSFIKYFSVFFFKKFLYFFYENKFIHLTILLIKPIVRSPKTHLNSIMSLLIEIDDSFLSNFNSYLLIKFVFKM